MKKIAILGSTGSIGTQAIDVIQAQPKDFSIEVLTAHSNVTLLARQAMDILPNAVVIANEDKYLELNNLLSNTDIKVFAGEKAIEQIVDSSEIDIVLTAMVGYSGLKPTIAAINCGKTIALANKETLVVAGDIITGMAKEKGVNIYPVDSEHSAIFQCLVGEWQNPIEKIYLTASGGPFRGKKTDELQHITKKEALKHPNWTMGSKITIDSATLMNKGLEVIEAKWLFNLRSDQIDVIVHPQSIIHSIVQFTDGSMKAQLGLPDMKLPIQYALGFPKRMKSGFPRFNFMDYPSFTFEKPDYTTFRCLSLAYEVLEKGGNAACILNAANEIAVDAFLHDRINFLAIPEIIERTLEKASFVAKPSLDDYFESNDEARKIAKDLV